MRLVGKWQRGTDVSLKLPLWVGVLMTALAFGAACSRSDKTARPPETKPQAQTQTSGFPQPRNDLPGLGNFARVSAVLYRGAQPNREGFVQLKSMGVKTVINLRDHHSDRRILRGLGFKYVHLPCETSDPEEPQVLAFLKVVADPANQPVFVHCQHGSDRTGMMVVCYRIVLEGWDKQQALEELPTFGFHNIWWNIRSFLLEVDQNALAKKLAHTQSPPVESVP